MARQVAGGGGTTIVKNASGNTEMYTVPSGKTFSGQIWNTSSNGFGYINGIRLFWPYSSSYFAHRPLQIELNAGDVVSGEGSGQTFLLGVER